MLTIEDKLDFYATARGRMGLIIDNLLLYFTGGVAFANIKHDYTINDPTIPALESFGASKSQFGVVVGAGAEYALSAHLSIKPEFLYFYFPEKETSFYSTAGGQTVHFDNQDSMWIVRVAVSYRF
jgi:outer membrane immunogenic protein